MRSNQTIGIDMPLKALVWQDEKGATWRSYNDPEWIVQRNGGAGGTEDTVGAISAALKALAVSAKSAELRVYGPGSSSTGSANQV